MCIKNQGLFLLFCPTSLLIICLTCSWFEGKVETKFNFIVSLCSYLLGKLYLKYALQLLQNTIRDKSQLLLLLNFGKKATENKMSKLSFLSSPLRLIYTNRTQISRRYRNNVDSVSERKTLWIWDYISNAKVQIKQWKKYIKFLLNFLF